MGAMQSYLWGKQGSRQTSAFSDRLSRPRRLRLRRCPRKPSTGGPINHISHADE
ncbi:unnamed protein product [Gulo gulo]|uniref:Uncharacterized protein n=1 Tax=Gulo gulo TaxID=48420 RepID=A0A9X9LZN5_GULGU|nr:unnamed protein product [Gulo gulo]